MNKDAATSQYTPMPDIASALRRRRDDIVHDWAARSAALREPAALAGISAIQFLSALADRLEQPHAPHPPLQPGTDAPLRALDLLLASRILRRSILQHLAADLQRQPTDPELATLDSRFDELTAELAGAIDAQLDELRAGDEFQSRYMSFLSHDLRGSLNGLVLMLEVMRRESALRSELADTTADIDLMRKSIRDTVAGMERYVQADRLRRHKTPVNKRPVELAPIVSAVVAELADQAAKRAVELATEVDPSLRVETDPELIRLALANLVDNAIRHGGRGPVRISVQQRQHQCVITVADRGDGIAPERLERLLHPARPAHLKEKGIGLTISHYVARALGGHLEADSAPARGSAFRLVLDTPSDTTSPPP